MRCEDLKVSLGVKGDAEGRTISVAGGVLRWCHGWPVGPVCTAAS